jgi:SAM-dependent methyltransferase
MTDNIINLQDWQQWLQTPAGQCLHAWEQAVFDHAVADAFGYHALQLGMPMIAGLRHNRIAHQFLAHDSPAQGVQLFTDFAALPFESNSLDLVLLPHTLELSNDPHATLREVERVLVPEGRVVITGFNPSSLWGLAQRRAHVYQRLGFGQLYLPRSGEFLAYRRLRDWLRLLSFEVQSAEFGAYRPAVSSPAWFERMAFMDSMGGRWWPIFGALYGVTAVKRVRGMRLMESAWKTRPALARAPVPVARRHGQQHHITQETL